MQKTNRVLSFKHAFKSSLKNFLISLGTLWILINFLKEYLKEDLITTSSIIFTIILIYWAIFFVKEYKFIKNYLDVLSAIDYIKSMNDKYKTIKYLNNNYRDYEQKYDVVKTKLELIKSFSPVPLVIFILAFVQKTHFSLVEKIKDNDNFLFFISSELLIVAVILFILWYIGLLLSTFSQFKNITNSKYKYLVAYEDEIREYKY